MSQQKPRARKPWQPPALRRIHAGSADQTGTTQQDGTGPGTNLS